VQFIIIPFYMAVISMRCLHTGHLDNLLVPESSKRDQVNKRSEWIMHMLCKQCVREGAYNRNNQKGSSG